MGVSEYFVEKTIRKYDSSIGVRDDNPVGEGFQQMNEFGIHNCTATAVAPGFYGGPCSTARQISCRLDVLTSRQAPVSNGPDKMPRSRLMFPRFLTMLI